MASVTKKVFQVAKLFKNSAKSVSQNDVRYKSVVASKLMYSEYGEPSLVVKKMNETLQTLQPDEIMVKMIAAPVNPADINTIQGKYPSRPTLPAVAGNEGVGEVIDVGAEVRNFRVGDRVVPMTGNLGTWRTHAIFPQDMAIKVPKNLGVVEAATLTVNPCTAYRMLKDFVALKPGDTVIQNGANSACGQNVIQICNVWGMSSVNIVRDRPNIAELKKFLMDLGATHVLTEEELRKTDIFKSGEMIKPRLALNCVGGKSALEIMRQLQNGCPMVTYGGMSREPITIPTSALIFKDVKLHGFWMTRWTHENFQSEDRMEMFEELISMMTNDELRGPLVEMVDFEDYREALENALKLQGMIGKKYILEFNK